MSRYRSSFRRKIRFENLEQRNMLAYLAGDYNLNGAVDTPDFDLWRSTYGEIGETAADGNGDYVVDGADYTLWRKNQGKTLANIPPDGPRNVEAASIGSTSIQVTWSAPSFASSYTIQRMDTGTETEFSTIASGITLTSFTDNNATTDTSYEYRVVASNANGSGTASQAANAVAGRANLTAHRPQSRQVDNAPVDAPIYAPFVKGPVRELDETSSTLGPGIRMNIDDDNQSGVRDLFESGAEQPLENDLIEVKVDRLPGQGNLVLLAGPRLRLFYNHDKETPIPLDVNGVYTESLPFNNNTITVFVEWFDNTHGTDNLTLVDQATSAGLDSVRFHSFHSSITVFGGYTQNPNDTDGDGSIGDPVKGGPNREGVFDIAQSLYDTGWNVMAFNEEAVDDFADIPYTEITRAVDWGQIDFFGIMGYSQGGGGTHDLIERLFDDGYVPSVGVWIDAIDHDGVFEENDWPNEVLYLLNIYEDNDTWLDGGPIINPEDMFPGTTLEEVDVTGWTPTINHSSIDDNVQVQTLIKTRINQWLPR